MPMFRRLHRLSNRESYERTKPFGFCSFIVLGPPTGASDVSLPSSLPVSGPEEGASRHAMKDILNKRKAKRKLIKVESFVVVGGGSGRREVVAFSPRGALLGAKECSRGPTFWCSNVTNAKNCHAVKHCIQTVWEHQKVPQDTDDICTLCKNMIRDARDQLESNETMEEIKQVFEGSCKLIHVKPVVKECIKFADEFVPELVDMLSSQMNPDVICSVAGLCNNANIDKMLTDIDQKKSREEERTKELQKDCESCMHFADIVGQRLEKSTPEDIKSYFLERCRSLGSFSVACSNLVDEYNSDIYTKLKNDFTASGLCYLTSSCVNGYGRKVHVKTESDLGVIHLNSDAISVAVKHMSEDQTCALCKQLVTHLKDILTSNTTEIEFEQVLKGLCKQTGKFKQECLSLADQYYDEIYRFIVNDLSGEEVCSFAGICTKPSVYVNGPIAPLLPEAPLPVRPILTGDDERLVGRVSVDASGVGVKTVTPAVQTPVRVEISFGDPMEPRFQLPVERMTVPVPQTKDLNVNNRESCVMCQYILHYIQKVISQPYSVVELKKVVENVCHYLPSTVTLECRNFIESFGDAFVAILAQEIDPSQVCPALRICPSKVLEDKYEPLEIVGKPSCPLCLMAIEDVTDMLKDKKNEESIRHALTDLCKRMPKSLQSQCDSFVENYTNEVIDMLLADFTPQEVCTYLKLCHTNVDVELVAPLPGYIHHEAHEVLTNEIPRDQTLDNSSLKQKSPPMCFLCEFVMDKIRMQLKDNQTEEEIEHAVLNVCRYMPTTVKTDCNTFVNRYAKYIIQMLVENTDPKVICSEMHMCREDEGLSQLDHVRRAVEECAMCEAIVGGVRGLLEDKNFDSNVSRYSARICNFVPLSHREQCKSMVMSYGPSIINLLVEFEVRPSSVCPRLRLCDDTEQTKVDMIETSSTSTATAASENHPQRRPHLLGGNSCTRGPAYWCQSEDHAKECGTLAHCREMVWKADKPNLAV